ncbi:diguanylate cyclase [Desulfovirgula thermocuniculi]|uniref:diguanylate cyclase n=1 Tax=Desulfovirgula thermocuniculi TaxID=348842 RepID=UPI00041AD2D6|nr:diguanylate cyclase [Desulfovirgula thermocuniculi]
MSFAQPLVLLLSQNRETVQSVAAQIDYNFFSLLITAREGEAAEFIRRGLPDVFIYEPQDPSCPSCLELASFQNLPIVMVTFPSEEFPACSRLHIAEILYKPINSEELNARLKSVTTLRQLEKQLADRPLPGTNRLPQVLLVEDSSLQQKIISRYLAEQGIETRVASTGREALEAARSHQPDLILLDIVLPDIDGIALCHELKKDPQVANVPVIFVTSKSGRENRLRGLECGADDFLTKPVDKRELVIRVQSFIRRKQLMDALLYQASRDSLTGLYNRRQLLLDLEREIARARRYGHPLSLIVLDVDHFKQYNDLNGHLAGDGLLTQLAQLITSGLRSTDLAYRYGGEEFVVLLPETDAAGAVQVAEKLRRKVEEYPFPHEQKQPGGNLTVSLGVAAFPDHAQSTRDLLSAADQAMYEAKSRGRNRVCLYGADCLPP